MAGRSLQPGEDRLAPRLLLRGPVANQALGGKLRLQLALATNRLVAGFAPAPVNQQGQAALLLACLVASADGAAVGRQRLLTGALALRELLDRSLMGGPGLVLVVRRALGLRKQLLAAVALSEQLFVPRRRG